MRYLGDLKLIFEIIRKGNLFILPYIRFTLVEMSAQMRRYISEREDFEFARGLNSQELSASTLRQSFLKKFVIGFDTNLYKTQEERDWAYICKRQYNYDVVLKSLGLSIMAANAVWSWRLFIRKGMVYWPIALVPVAYYMISPVMLQKHSKKLFDMCNLGEDFYLGQKRNEVLTKCNQILKVQDF